MLRSGAIVRNSSVARRSARRRRHTRESYLRVLRRDLGPLADGSEIVPPTLAVDGTKTLDLGDRKLI